MEDLEVLSEYQRTIRGRANASLQDLKMSLNKSPPRKGRTLSSPSSSPVLRSYFSAGTDYNTAVDRLRMLIQEQDARHGKSEPTRPRVLLPMFDMATASDAGRSPAVSMGGGMVETLPKASELLPLINNYISYIHQLEGKNRFIEDELKIIKLKMEEVIDDNTRLHEQLKTMVVEVTLDEPGSQDEKPGAQTEKYLETAGVIDPKNVSEYKIELEKVAALYAGKTNRLEAQLKEARDELERAEGDLGTMKTKVRLSESKRLLGTDKAPSVEGLCVKCAQNDAVLASIHSDMNIKTIDRLTGERDDLMGTVTRLKSSIEDMRRREGAAHEHVKQSIELVEQSQLEKNQALVEKEQLKGELQRQLENYKQMLVDNQKSLDQEKQLYMQQCAKQMENVQLQHQHTLERLTATETQMDKVSRDKAHILSELEETKSQLADYTARISKKSANIKLSNATAIAQRDEAMRQLKNVRDKALWEGREKEQEIERLHIELKDVKRRLADAEKQASRATNSHMRTMERLSAAEKTVHGLQTSVEEMKSTRENSIQSLAKKAQEREAELLNLVDELESKHTSTKSELEKMLSSQKTLISKLKEECQRLAQALEKASEMYSSEIRQLREMNDILSTKQERLTRQHSEMEQQCVQHAKMHKVMTARVKDMEKHGHGSSQQVVELLNKLKCASREKEQMQKEVNFLQQQLATQTRINQKVRPVTSNGQ
ncbi:serologically defined colon cancer antigen 8 homolog [Glandiceps talaboti]